MNKLVIISGALLLSACSSVPRPPVPDGSNRHAVNSPKTAEVIALRAQLAESEERLRVVAAKMVLPAPVSPSQTFTVYFPYNSTQFRLNDYDKDELRPLLMDARRIEVRGRTDGQRPSAADERIALNRALAAQRFLVEQGVSPAIISINYVSSGDYVADNSTSAGKARNRRVDIVVFNKQR